MADNLTLHGLKHKKARLLGEKLRLQQNLEPLNIQLEALQLKISKMQARSNQIDEQVETLTRTLEAFGSSASVKPVKDCAKWVNGLRRGTFKFEVLNAVRQSAQPQTTREIATSIGLNLGLELSDPLVWRKLRRQTNDYLNLFEKKGQVVKLLSCINDGGSIWQKP